MKKLAKQLGIEEAALRAVADVESNGSGFLADGRPRILFEGHIFHRLTAGKFAKHRTISYPVWTRAHYIGGAGEYGRLAEARTLDAEAADKSSSWGMFQIMGFNHAACGFNSVSDFVRAHEKSREEHLRAFANFIDSMQLTQWLIIHDWKGFARRYNGPAYANNKYDIKLRNAYEKWKRLLD